MSSTKATARLAGILYIVMGIPAWFSLMSIPSALYVHGNATATTLLAIGTKENPLEAQTT